MTASLKLEKSKFSMPSSTTYSSSDHNVSRGHVLTITSAVTGVIAVIAVLLRAVTKAKILKATGWDDWSLYIALVVTAPTLRYCSTHRSLTYD